MRPAQTLTHGGVTRTVREWADRLGIKVHALRARMASRRAAGEPVDMALSGRRRGRPDRFIELDGQKLSVNAWSERRGLSAWMIRWRLRKGWSEREAVMAPKGARKAQS